MALDPSSRQVAIVILAAASCLINNILISSCACPCNRFNRFNNGVKVNNTLREETFRVRNNTLEDCASKLEDCASKTVIFILGTIYMNCFIYAMISLAALSLPIKQEDDVHKDTAAVATSSLPAAKNGSVTTLNTLLDVE